MNLANRSFMDNRTGEVIKVIDSFENIAILSDKSKMDVRRLMDSSLFTEYIDPKKFIDNTSSTIHNSIFESIKSIPTNSIPFEDEQGEMRINPAQNDPYMPRAEEPVVYTSSIEDEKAELARKYGASIDNTAAQSRQNEAFARLLGEEELPVVTPRAEEPVQRVEIIRDDNTGAVVSSEQVIQKTQETPIDATQNVAAKQTDQWEMFRGIKRGTEFKLDLPLTNKIPKLEFIEMMEDSYDKSIIEFLSHDITNEILANPETLRKSIESKIREMVYGKPEEKTPVKKAAPKTAPKRAPKPNTAVGEKPGAKKPARKATAKKETENQ